MVLLSDPRASNRLPGSLPLIIGHRGASGEAPENTLASFELALSQGADGIEFDVHLSADGVPVVIHDPRVDRTTSGRGRVRDHTVAVLKQLDAGYWFYKRHPSRVRHAELHHKIPTLAEALAWVRERRCLAYVEIKQTRPRYAGIEERVLEEIHRARVAAQATVISFSLATLGRVRRLDPQIALGLDCTRPLLAIRRAKSVGASVVLPHWAFTRRPFVDRAHRAGLSVVVWDLDEERWMSKKIADGVDGIITRYPSILAELLGRASTAGRC